MTFDPYHKWLGIRAEDQPPDHYRLLGIDRFEDDPDVIDSAADQRMTHLRSFQNGKHAQLSQRLLNEVSAARICLLDPEKRVAYDQPLREAMQQAEMRSPLDGIAEFETLQPRLHELAPIAIQKPAAPLAKQKKPPWFLPAVIGGSAFALLVVVLVVLGSMKRPTKQDVKKRNEGRSTSDRSTSGRATSDRSTSDRADSSATDSTSDESASIGEDPDNKQEISLTGTVDLLSQIDVERDAVAGQWRMEDGQLVSPLDKNARLQLPHDVPEEYVLSLEVNRKSGSPLLIGLVVGDRRARIEIDSWSPSGIGLGDIDGKVPNKNETWHEERLLGRPDQKNVIVCTVRHNQIIVVCNSRELINWTGDPGRLTDWVKVPDQTRLYVCSFIAEFHFSKIELAPFVP